MNQHQQARRTQRRALKALLCEEIPGHVYRGLLAGKYVIHGNILSIVMTHSRTGRPFARKHIRQLETPRARAQRELDDDIDQLLGIRTTARPRTLSHKELQFAQAYGFTIKRPESISITGAV